MSVARVPDPHNLPEYNFEYDLSFNVIGGEFTGSTTGIYLGEKLTVEEGSVHLAKIHNNSAGFINNSPRIVNAICNWWGAADGPSGSGSGGGNSVSQNVAFSPWATTPEFVSINAGLDQTIYIGYGIQTKTLTATSTACNYGNTSYLWSTGSTALNCFGRAQ